MEKHSNILPLFEGFYETIHDIALEQFYEVDPSSLE
jgi:hypothetical protein